MEITGIVLSYHRRRSKTMKYIKVLTDSNLERIQGGDDLINFYELGEK